MVNLVISGCNGRMGRAVEALCREDGGVTVTAGFDPLGQGEQRPFPVFSSPALFSGEADVVVDFSHPSALDGLLDFALSRKVPLVLATIKVMGINPIGAAVLVWYAATAAYLTPMSCPLIPLSMAAGGYDFKSVFKQALIPSLLMILVGVGWTSILYPIF